MTSKHLKSTTLATIVLVVSRLTKAWSQDTTDSPLKIIPVI